LSFFAAVYGLGRENIIVLLGRQCAYLGSLTMDLVAGFDDLANLLDLNKSQATDLEKLS
jgi:hypothetical protein